MHAANRSIPFSTLKFGKFSGKITKWDFGAKIQEPKLVFGSFTGSRTAWIPAVNQAFY